jgi:hypothetical protein
MPDLQPFVSPVDGSVISGRRAMRDHFKQHGVTNVADYKNEWEAKAKERARLYTPGSGFDRERRIEAIKYAYEKHTRRR